MLLLGAGALQLPALGRMAMQGVGIIEFELMRTPSDAVGFVAQLGGDGVAAARQQVALDFVFLVLYAVMIGGLCLALAGRAGPGTWVARVAPAVTGVGIAAATFDALNNVALLVVLGGTTAQPWPGLAGISATLTFVLLGVVVLYLALGFLTVLRRASPAESVQG